MENIALTLENVTGKGLGFKLKDISAKFENGYIYAITGTCHFYHTRLAL